MVLQTFVYKNDLYFQPNPFTTPVQVTDNRGENYVYNGISDWLYEGLYIAVVCCIQLTSFFPISAPTLSTFKNMLKTHLFSRSQLPTSLTNCFQSMSSEHCTAPLW